MQLDDVSLLKKLVIMESLLQHIYVVICQIKCLYFLICIFYKYLRTVLIVLLCKFMSRWSYKVLTNIASVFSFSFSNLVLYCE